MAAPETVAFGSLVFDATQFEVPEDLEFTKVTMGGVADIPQTDGLPATRASQTIGVTCDTIRFYAWFLGRGAEAKSQQLEALQLAQASQRFQRGIRAFDATIYKLSLAYHSANEIKYTIELEPIAETSAAGSAVSPAATVADNTEAINSLLAAAPADARLDDSLAGSADAIAQLQALGPTDAAAIPDLSARVLEIVAEIDYLQALQGSLAASTLAGDVTTYLFASQLSGALSVLVASLGSFTGAKSSTVLPGAMNLYELAVHFTGDIGNADAIMAANPAITDPFNLGTAPIAIPGL